MPSLPSKFALIIAGFSLLSACSVPQGAAEQRQILAGADAPEATFAVHTVTRDTLPNLSSWAVQGRSDVQGWIKRSRGPADQIIEAGDIVDISIWDNEESSLLMQPQQKVVALKAMTVTQKGTVFLPYLDEVYIAKMSPDKARATVQERMKTIIPSAQVQLSHTSGRKSSVDLVSGVRSPGNFVMPDRDFTITGLLAMGGGVANDMRNPQVRLSRDGKLYGVSMDKMLKNPSLDTTLRGGDKIFVEQDPRYFLSLGAAGREAQIPFPTDAVTALDAMSLIGGIDEKRGTPKGILVLRDYDPAAVKSDGSGPEKERIVFALDLTSADGLFSAGKFPIYDRDLVLVTESSLTTTDTILNVLAKAVGINARL
ncbi:MAG: polysaccharide biosynthesis/export family protein [Paracoccaceae bacterium]|nr:polysaccharide biosynthesis/export family protein [Paracoccaceae bacterium]